MALLGEAVRFVTPVLKTVYISAMDPPISIAVSPFFKQFKQL